MEKNEKYWWIIKIVSAIITIGFILFVFRYMDNNQSDYYWWKNVCLYTGIMIMLAFGNLCLWMLDELVIPVKG